MLYEPLSLVAHISTINFVATSVAVERAFSRGRLLLSHVRNRLSAQTTRALLCLGEWSGKGFVRDKDIMAVATLADVDEENEADFEEGWDAIKQ